MFTDIGAHRPISKCDVRLAVQKFTKTPSVEDATISGSLSVNTDEILIQVLATIALQPRQSLLTIATDICTRKLALPEIIKYGKTLKSILYNN